MLWLSAGKPLTAVAIMQQVERGTCRLDDPVSLHLPEFAAGGKETITIRHLLTHTGGFRTVDTGWPEASWDEIIAAICRTQIEPGWTPGQTAGYHPYTSWYILGELVQRLSRACSANMYGAKSASRSAWTTPGSAWIRSAIEPMATASAGCKTPSVPACRRINGRAKKGSCTVHRGGAYGPIRELGFFYEALSRGGQRGAGRVLSPESVAALIAPQRVGLVDETFRQKIDWGLGVILDSKRYNYPVMLYGYGRHASPAHIWSQRQSIERRHVRS